MPWPSHGLGSALAVRLTPLLSVRRHSQLQPQRLDDPQQRRQLRIAIFAQRLVQRRSGYAWFAGDFGHAARATTPSAAAM